MAGRIGRLYPLRLHKALYPRLRVGRLYPLRVAKRMTGNRGGGEGKAQALA